MKVRRLLLCFSTVQLHWCQWAHWQKNDSRHHCVQTEEDNNPSTKNVQMKLGVCWIVLLLLVMVHPILVRLVHIYNQQINAMERKQAIFCYCAQLGKSNGKSARG